MPAALALKQRKNSVKTALKRVFTPIFSAQQQSQNGLLQIKAKGAQSWGGPAKNAL
jgi:hypothetical protein